MGHKAVGTTYLYRPLLEKKDYLKGHLSGIAANYFNGDIDINNDDERTEVTYGYDGFSIGLDFNW